MFVSPFLPEPLAAETDDQFVERAMSGGAAGDGGYPLRARNIQVDFTAQRP